MIVAGPEPDEEIAAKHRRLTHTLGDHPTVPLGLAWWQEHLLDWASEDPEFRARLLQFVDVLPTLRTAAAVGDHVRQYFRGLGPPPLRVGSELAGQRLLRPAVSRAVRQAVLAMSRRFIAGATPEEALPRLVELAREGTGFSVDLLGESTLSEAEAEAYLARYLALLRTLGDAGARLSPRGGQWQDVPSANISVKLSALCARFEPAAPDYVYEMIAPRLRGLLRAARDARAHVYFDMEQYRFKELTHRIFATVVSEPEFAGWADVGIVVQAYLKSAEDDLDRLVETARRRGAPITIRLVKGAYWDEERVIALQNGWPVPVFEAKSETDACYERCTDLLLDSWPHLRPAFGTHNPRSIAQAVVKAERRGRTHQETEFQMLYGMAEDVRAAVHREGFRTRVYLPVGEIIPGMGYLVRRLLENSSNLAWFRANGRQSSDGNQQATRPVILSGFQNAPPAQLFEADPRARMEMALHEAQKQKPVQVPVLIGPRELWDRESMEVRYPAEPARLLGFVAQATAADVALAVSSARSAYASWRDLGAAGRAVILRRAADLMQERRFALAAQMVYESAKPWYEADGDVIEAVDYLRYYASSAEELERPQPLGGYPGEENCYFHEGRGVAAVIAPWNFPLAIVTGMAAAALAAGNAVVVKPSEWSPLIAFRMVTLLREAGVPPEVLHFLPGPGETVGQAMVGHPGVDIIAFTGSSEVGLEILSRASRVRPGQRQVKRIVAEMGGKNALVVDEDADLDQAIADVLASAFGYAGQKCSACSRLVLVGSVWETALERLRGAVESLVVGPPHQPATQVPPVISLEARDGINAQIEGAVEDGARLLVRGRVPTGNGYYVAPSVFINVDRASRLARREVFGPVLAVFQARNFEDALDIALDSAFALTDAVHSRNPRHIEQARRRFRVGNLYINRRITGAIVARQPFGGLALSGFGEKAGGPDYVRQFMEPRVVTENTVRRGFVPDV